MVYAIVGENVGRLDLVGDRLESNLEFRGRFGRQPVVDLQSHPRSPDKSDGQCGRVEKQLPRLQRFPGDESNDGASGGWETGVVDDNNGWFPHLQPPPKRRMALPFAVLGPIKPIGQPDPLV